MGEICAEYRMPKECEECGSENLVAKAIFDTQVVRYICLDCSYSRSLPKVQNLKKRNNTTQSNWARRVINRDRCCVICGSQEHLEAHHIVPVSHSESLRYEDANGITLCRMHHLQVHHKLPNQERS